MSDDLEAVVRRALDLAVDAGADAAEAYAEDSRGREVRVFGGAVESLTDAGQRGVGVRTWIEGRVGYAYGTDLSDAGLAAVSGGAAGAARAVDPDDHAAVPDATPGPPRIEGLFDARLAQWDTPRKVELALAIEAAALAADPRIAAVETTVYADEEARFAIASTNGIAAGAELSSCYAYLQAIAAGDDGDRQTGLGFGLGRSPAALDPEAIGREAASRAVAVLGARKPPSRSCPVVLDPTVAASFVGFIGGTLCADAVQRGRSPFAGRLGDAVAAEAFRLADDGAIPEGLASSPVDGEGTPRRRIDLITAGRLDAYLHDSYTARREGGAAATTASASRSGYRSPPSVSPSNLVVGAGTESLDELIARAGDGMLVTDVAGLHSGVNPVSGTFSVGATGRVIREGALAEGADEFTIASDLVSMLGGVVAVGRDARWVPFGGSVLTPPLLVEQMAIAGS